MLHQRAAIGWMSWLLLSCAAFSAQAAPGVSAAFRYGALELHFDRPMQTWQNELAAGAVKLEPALPTTCHWQSDIALRCSFAEDKKAKAATRYRINLAAGLKTQPGQTLPAISLQAETDRPTLSAQLAQWTDGRPQIHITADASVATDAVKAALQLSLDGKPAPLPGLRALPSRGEWDKAQRYHLVLPETAATDAVLAIGVVPGLRSSEGPLPGKQKEVLLSVVLNEPFQLRGGVCAGLNKPVSAAPKSGDLSLDCMPGESVRLFFSQRLHKDARSAWIEAWPASVGLQESGTEDAWRYRSELQQPRRAPAYWVSLKVDAANADVTIPVPASLRDSDGNSGLTPVNVRIRTGDYRPGLRAAHTRNLFADGRRPPSLADAINAPSVNIDVAGVGADFRKETIATPSRRDNAPLAVASEVVARTLAEGGWAEWSLPSAGSADGRQILQFASPGFDLFAVSGRREVLAWANHWDDAGPVAGAAVELLWMENANSPPRVVAGGVTAKDGTALIGLPDDLVVENKRTSGNGYPRWLLRAASGRRAKSARAVLPMGAAHAWGTELGHATKRKFWGVADRPLYRAGDTVRYHLWLRDDIGGRLLRSRSTGPVALRLAREYNDEEVILGWDAAPDTEGTISGELVLPVHLPDDTYCIGSGKDSSIEGSCFYVGTYRAQDLWAEAKLEDRVLRDGDRMSFDIAAGYYSGGPAAGVPVSQVTAQLEAQPLQQAYPQYAGYDFVDVRSGGGSGIFRIADADKLKLVADADGKAHGDLAVVFEQEDLVQNGMPAFGRLQLTAEVKPEDRDSTSANVASTRYARYRRYVGLRMQPQWLDATTPVSLEGIVIDAEGRPAQDSAVEVEVRYLPGFENTEKDAQAAVIKRCTLQIGQAGDCSFARAKSGRYRLLARSGDAAPAELTRYVWVDGDGVSGITRTEVQLLQTPARRGEEGRLLLKQRDDHARALLVFSAGDNRILAHGVETVAGQAQQLVFSTAADWPKQVRLSVYVRGAPDTEPLAQGLRKPIKVSNDDADLRWPATQRTAAPLALSFAAATAKPGDTVEIVLRNDSAHPRTVVLAVVDDAMRALAARLLPYFDPQGEYWLGREYYNDRLGTASFAGWNDGAWRRWLAWPEAKAAAPARPQPDCSRLRAAAAAACEAEKAAISAADAAASDERSFGYSSGGVNPIDVASVESTTILTREQIKNIPHARDTTEVALLAPGTVRNAPPAPAPPPPPPPGEPVLSADAAAMSLDSVTVVGTAAIEPAALSGAGKGRVSGLRPREELRNLRALARVRTQFADTALWQPDIRLAPGETRSIPLKLPDNLTRWRALAWSSDADDDFDLAEAAIEVGLSVEVRLQAPVRLYPGDRSRLAVNVRQTAEHAAEASAGLQVAGGDGGDAGLDYDTRLSLAARGQNSFGAEIAPQRTGTLLATASAQTDAGRDAVAAPIDVASPTIQASKVQAGWLGANPLTLDLPALPAGAEDARLQVSLLRGGAGLVQQWTQDLRDYQHRCWEQILSRAVAAALAIERGATQDWPDAPAAVKEAIDNASVFQEQDGSFRYFAEPSAFEDISLEDPKPQVALTAYAAQAFDLLRGLGHPVGKQVEEKTQEFLEDYSPDGDEPADRDQMAFAIASSGAAASEELDDLWEHWSELSLPGRIAGAEALARKSHASAGAAVARLLETAPARGEARVLAATQGADRWMGSRMREQCALIGLLRDYPQLADAGAGRSLTLGLTDLYAGGIAAVDTQTGAICLMALRDRETSAGSELAMDVRIGTRGTQLKLQPGQDRTDWTAERPAAKTLILAAPEASRVPASFIAQLDYREDARHAQASAVGFSIERRHEVLGGGRWLPIADRAVREGDWIRVTLVINNGAPRYFVAVTDSVAGGLRPTDLSLSGVAGLDLKRISGLGSYWFSTRKLDPRTPRFYAEYLPAGRHEIHYFARAANSGDYLAAPALAELMYGSASRARTAAMRLRIGTGKQTP